MGAYQTFYDVRQSWIGFAPILLTLFWLLGLVVAIRVIKNSRLAGAQRRLLLVWLLAWTAFGGLGFANVWYKHFHCIRELESGKFRVAQGQVTSFSPEHDKIAEHFTVGGVTFKYDSANLGRGGLRWTGGKHGPLHDGAFVRVSYDAHGVILRLEISP